MPPRQSKTETDQSSPDMLDPMDRDGILHSLPEGAIVADCQTGRIMASNPYLERWCGYTQDELVSKKISDLLEFSESDVSTSNQNNPQAGFWHTADHQEIRVKVKATDLPNQTRLLLISPLSEDAALMQAHSDFVSTVSHEFRTPLTSIKGFADTLLQYEKQLSPEQQKRFITIIKEQADRLIRLSENVLSVSTLSAGRIQLSLRAVSLQRLLDKICQSIQVKYTSKPRFIFRLHPQLPAVWADPDRLEQILINLIDNAVKYSDSSPVITIRAKVCPDDPQQLQIEIIDEGIGIPKEHQENLFSKFYRVETPLTQKVEGTGLGLYITQSLVFALDGEIQVKSPLDDQTGRGTCFTLTFPVATPERQASHQKKRGKAYQTPLTEVAEEVAENE